MIDDSVALGSINQNRLDALVRERLKRGPTSHTRLCLFLGAGADISSNGLTFFEFKKRAYELLHGGRIFDSTSEAQMDREFQKIFSPELPLEERNRIIERIFRNFRNAEPSDSYKILALLIKFGGLDAVITTNFDVMLEKAAESIGGRTFETFAPGLAIPHRSGSAKPLGGRCPYLKIHGDLSGGVICQLTEEELANDQYEPALKSLLVEILETHNIVFTGYSGNDPALAELAGQAVRNSANAIYWCNPSPPNTESPMSQALSSRQLCYIPADFEKCVSILSRPVLERPFPNNPSVAYIGKLLDWRTDFTNAQFVEEYGYHQNQNIVPTFVRRDKAEKSVNRFMASERNLAAIIGPSGYGKTTLGIRLHANYPDSKGQPSFMLLKSKSCHSNDFESAVLQRMGIAPGQLASIFSFERYLTAVGRRLVIFLDAINEYSPNLADCVALFRNVLRVAYSLPERSSIKIVVTSRHETWTAMLPLIDQNMLATVLWSDGLKSAKSISPIMIERFTYDELQRAINGYKKHGLVAFSYQELLPTQQEELRDPFTLRAVLETSAVSLPQLSGTALYRHIIEWKIASSPADINSALIDDVLAELSALCFSRRNDSFRALDLHRLSPPEVNLERLLKDVGIINEADDGLLRFGHERIQEYFLSVAIGRSELVPPLETTEDLQRILQTAGNDNKMLSAACIKLCSRENLFHLVEEALLVLPDQVIDIHSDQAKLFQFCKRVLLTAVHEQPQMIEDFCQTVILASSDGNIPQPMLRTVVQTASALESRKGISLLTKASGCANQLAAVEARIFLIDQLAELFLLAEGPVDLLGDEFFSDYFNESSAAPWVRVFRLLEFAGALGPDNTHPLEYDRFSSAMGKAISKLWSEVELDYQDVMKIVDFIQQNKDRYLFNTLDRELDEFFSSQDREKLLWMLDRIEEGNTLDASDLELFRPMMQSMVKKVQRLFNNLLVALSAGNDFQAFQELWLGWTAQFDDSSYPEEVDFYGAVTAYAYIMNGHEYDGILDELTSRVLEKMPRVVGFSPGIMRGTLRGLVDSFDMVFEDGFNPISGYLFMNPSRRRIQHTHREYRRRVSVETESISDLAPEYSQALETFLSKDNVHLAVRILHAIGQAISIWPREGLACLHELVGYQDQTFRRALIRLLSEAYARHPIETQHFLDLTRGSFMDQEYAAIRSSLDTKVGTRQFETIEWARILNYVANYLPEGRKMLIRFLRNLYRCNSLKEVVISTCGMLGVYEPGLK